MIDEDAVNYDRVRERSYGIILELDNENEKYNQIKTKIRQEVIPKLNNAKNQITEAKNNLGESYSGEGSKKKKVELDTYIDKINTIINKLNKIIIQQIDYNMGVNEQKITKEEEAINEAYRRLRGGRM